MERFSNDNEPAADVEAVISEHREAAALREDLDEAIQHARTFGQLSWHMERIKMLAPGRDPMVIGKEGAVPIEALLAEIESEDLGRARGTTALDVSRTIPTLMQRILEMRAMRSLIEQRYAAKEHIPIVPESKPKIEVRSIPLDDIPGARPAKDRTPVMIAPGFGVGPPHMKRFATSMAELGRSVITYGVPKGDVEFDPSIGFTPDTPMEAREHASALLRTMEYGSSHIFKNQEKYDVVAYSFGAINALIAAREHPEKFRNIVLVNPAGLTEAKDPRLLRLVKLISNAWNHRQQVIAEAANSKRSKALYREFAGGLDPKKAARGVIGFFRSLMNIDQDAMRTLDAISRANLVPLIRELSEKGVKISVLAAEHDALFDVEQIERAAMDASVNVYALKGAHANVGFNPSGVAEVLIDTLEGMSETRPEETVRAAA